MTQHLHGEARAALIADVTARYEAGATIRQVAEVVGYSYGAVRNILVGAGVPLRQPHRGAAPLPEDPLAAACPQCSAPPETPCRRPSWRPNPRPHRERITAVAEARP